jgi:hypothetical protein
MAAAKKTEAIKEEMVTVFVPRLPNSKNQPPMEGSVNGKAFLLPRGQHSEVPASVAEVVNRSLRNEQIAEDYYNSIGDKLLKDSAKEAAMTK